MSERFQRAMRLIDDVHAADPRRVPTCAGEIPRELLYAQRLTETLHAYAPDASEALQLAARAQHLERWLLPRDTYPMTRAGYHQWRGTLATRHATRARELLAAAGYDADMQERVTHLILKRNLATDNETQTLEDVICLVFLQHDLEPFAAKHAETPDKIVDILRKTWKKMSPRAQTQALSLHVSAATTEWLTRALQPPPV
jgi:Zn-dependent oligopeptidase